VQRIQPLAEMHLGHRPFQVPVRTKLRPTSGPCQQLISLKNIQPPAELQHIRCRHGETLTSRTRRTRTHILTNRIMREAGARRKGMTTNADQARSKGRQLATKTHASKGQARQVSRWRRKGTGQQQPLPTKAEGTRSQASQASQQWPTKGQSRRTCQPSLTKGNSQASQPWPRPTKAAEGTRSQARIICQPLATKGNGRAIGKGQPPWPTKAEGTTRSQPLRSKGNDQAKRTHPRRSH